MHRRVYLKCLCLRESESDLRRSEIEARPMFVQIEAQFFTASITVDETKYNYVIHRDKSR